MMKHGTGGWVDAFTFAQHGSLAAVERLQVLGGLGFGVKGLGFRVGRFRVQCLGFGGFRA